MVITALKATLAAGALVIGMMPLGAQATLFGVSSQQGGVSSLYTIDQTTGAATFIANTPEGAAIGLSFLGGTLYGSDMFGGSPPGGFLPFGTTDTTIGAYTGVSNQGFSGNWWGLASNESAGLLYAYDNEGGALRSTPGGAITQIGDPSFIGASGLGFDDANGILYAVNSNDLYTLDIVSGAASLIGSLGISGSNQWGLDYDEIAQTLFLNGGNFGGATSLYSVNVSTGVATLIGTNGVNGIDGLAWIAEPVPKPSTLGLIGLGLVGLGAMKRRRLHS